MPGIRKHSSLDGTRTGLDCETLPSAVRVSGPNRETGGGKFRRKGRDRPLVRLFVRGITNPHTILLGVLAFVATTALCFFGQAAHRREDGRRLTALQEFAADVDVPERESQPGPQTVLSKPDVLVQSELFREVQSEECSPSSLSEKTVDPSEYEFGCDEIEEMLAGEKKLLGKVDLRDAYLVQRGERELVVKALRDDFEQRGSKKRADKIHRREAAALDAIRGHPNIAGLLGICESSSVSEYLPTRLDDLLLKPGAKPLAIASVVSMALDAARGVQAMHEAPGGPVIHFDIKPRQMVLDANGRVKINNLNTCKFPSTDAGGNTCACEFHACNPGPFRAPENIAGQPLTEKLDVYSLAMTFYSMLALKRPYAGQPGSKERILNGVPPPVDPSWHPGFMEIVRDMWQRDPNARPSARRVAERLEELQKQLQLE